jgi:hypothetical protein
VLCLDRPVEDCVRDTALGGAVRVQRLEGSRLLRGRCAMGVGWGLVCLVVGQWGVAPMLRGLRVGRACVGAA